MIVDSGTWSRVIVHMVDQAYHLTDTEITQSLAVLSKMHTIISIPNTMQAVSLPLEIYLEKTSAITTSKLKNKIHQSKYNTSEGPVLTAQDWSEYILSWYTQAYPTLQDNTIRQLKQLLLDYFTVLELAVRKAVYLPEQLLLKSN